MVGIIDSMDVSLSELQEMVTDREAWRAVIHGVTKSRTRLSDWTDWLTDWWVTEYIIWHGFEDYAKNVQKALWEYFWAWV